MTAQPAALESALQSVLLDAHGRRIHYLRLSVTDRCDLRCSYCLPVEGAVFMEPAHWLHFDELLRLARVFVAAGISHIRLTGGEPLTRSGVAAFASQLAKLPGLTDLSLSTNATRLDRHALALKTAGVQRVNVSLDTLRPARFAQMTGRDCLPDVLRGLQAARRAGLAPIKLNMVVQRGVNDDEAADMTAFAIDNACTLRLIEVMPMGSTGQSAMPVDVTKLARELAAQFGLLPDVGVRGPGPARYWVSQDGGMSLGAITPLSQHFCADCNRVRLTADGNLHLCLGDEASVPLGSMLRAGAKDEELLAAIHAGLMHKPERHHFTEQPQKVVRFMARTGG